VADTLALVVNERQERKLLMYKPSTETLFTTLLLVSLFVWALTVFTTVYTFSTDVFSYFYTLPWSYWVSLGFLITSLSLRLTHPESSKKWVILDLLLILVFVLVLFGTPCIIEKNARMLDVYGHTGAALMVQSSGHAGSALLSNVDISPFAYSVVYPGFFIFLSAFWSTTGLLWNTTIQFYPIFLMLTISFLIYLITRKFNNRFAVLAPIVFLSFDWFQAFHGSPESFGLILYLVFWLIFSKFLLSKNFYNKRLLLVILIYSSICISHPGTPIFILCNIIFLIGITILLLKTKFFSLNKQFIGIFLMCFSLYIVFNLNSANISFIEMLRSASSSLVSLFSQEPALKTISLINSNYYFTNLSREIETGFITLISFVSGLLLLHNKSQRKTSIILIVWLLSCWVFVLYSLGNSGTYIERPAMFGMVPASILLSVCGSSIKKPKNNKIFAVFCLVLIACGSLLLPITRNANDAFETPTSSYMSAGSFAVSYANEQVADVSSNLAITNIYTVITGKYSIHATYLLGDAVLFPKYCLFLFDQPGYSRVVNTGNTTYYQATQDFCDSELYRIFDNYGSQIYINRFDNLNMTKTIG
jgi:hypothetical protein